MKRHWCLTLALVLGVEALAPLAHAQTPPDELRDAFANLQNFARRAEQPATEAKFDRDAGMPAPVRDDHLGLTTSVHVYQRDDGLSPAERRALAKEFSEILHAVDPGHTQFVVTTHWGFVPVVEAKTYGNDPRTHLYVPMGLFAFVENRDELTAVIAQAISRGAPEVFGHRDDPRVMRRLSEQVAFEGLPARQRDRIRADLSAIERLRAAERRPWALTDFEGRVVPFFRDTYQRKFSYLIARKILPLSEAERRYFEDDLFEVRLLAQKVAVTYLQERENVRELIRTTHEFSPEMRVLRKIARRHFSASLHPFGQLTKYGPVFAAPVAVIAALLHSPEAKRLINEAVYAVVDLVPDAFYKTIATVGHVQMFFYRLTWDALWAAGVAAVDGAIVAAAFVKNVLLGPVWDILVEVFGPLGNAVAWAFHHGVDAAAWIFGDYYPLKLAGVVVTAALAYVGRGAIREIGGVMIDNGWQLSFWTIGQINRLRHSGYIEAQLQNRRDGSSEFEALSKTARDLNRIFVEGVRASFSVAILFDTTTLQTLSGGYQAPEDFWSMLKEFVRILGERTARGALTAAELKTLLFEAMPSEVPQFSIKKDFTDIDPGDQHELIFRMLQRKDLRPLMANLYRAARARFPGRDLPLADVDGEKVLWTELNETSVDTPVLGVMRLAAEIVALPARPDVRLVRPLNALIGERLNMDRLVSRVNQIFWPETMTGFDGSRPADDTREILRLFNHARHVAVLGGPVGDYSIGDTWPLIRMQYAAARVRATLAGNLEKAAALATWESTSFNHLNLYRQPLATLGTALVDLAEATTRPLTTVWFRRKLASFDRVTSLARYVETELLPRAARPQVLTPQIYTLVVERPELIKDQSDVYALLDLEIFWPQTPIRTANPLKRFAAEFNSTFRDFDSIDDRLRHSLEHQKQKYPRTWRYETRLSQRLHRVILDRLAALDLMPRGYEELKTLWLRLSERGVTSETDRLMQDLIARAAPRELSKLQTMAIKEGRVWETELHSRLSIARAFSRSRYRRLIKSSAEHPDRPALLDDVIDDLKASLPERGIAFAKFLEDLSVEINSSYDEAKLISAAKGDVNSAQANDSNFEAIRAVFRKVAAWPRRDQFAFVRFLRGEAKPSGRLLAAFPAVGVERVQRMYEILPIGARVGLFDTFFTHGLLRDSVFADAWTRRLSRYIVGGQKTEAQIVTLQVLTAFLFAIREVGNKQMTTTILSYLYALPSAAVASPVEVLKLVLELFGATGIKVGQFTYASQILGESGQALRSLQSRARVPDRIEMYEDVYDLLGVPIGSPLPFAVLELLGAASMKYAFMGQDRANLSKLVIKVFRLDAMNNVDLQFDVLEHMSEYLIAHYGPRYGVFKIIIASARRAVKREGSMANEIRRSRIARHRVYADRSTDEVKVEVPREDLVNPRMIIAQYAPGVPFDELPEEAKPMFARHLLTIEESIYFADARVLRFDPDRHAGNAQMLFGLDPRGGVVMTDRRGQLGPIDFGQLTRMASSKRERITKLFALAQIAGRVTVNPWVVNEIGALLELNEAQRENLRRHLKAHVKAAEARPVTLYVATLAALDAAGFAITDTAYIDFVRGLIQLTPFERYAPEAPAPSRTFERHVVAQIRDYLGRFEFQPHERAYVDATNAWRRLRGALTGREFQLLPTDLSQINFDELIQRETTVACQELLEAAS